MVGEAEKGVGFPEAIRVNSSSSEIVLNIRAAQGGGAEGKKLSVLYQMRLFFLDMTWTTLGE